MFDIVFSNSIRNMGAEHVSFLKPLMLWQSLVSLLGREVGRGSEMIRGQKTKETQRSDILVPRPNIWGMVCRMALVTGPAPQELGAVTSHQSF